MSKRGRQLLFPNGTGRRDVSSCLLFPHTFSRYPWSFLGTINCEYYSKDWTAYIVQNVLTLKECVRRILRGNTSLWRIVWRDSSTWHGSYTSECIVVWGIVVWDSDKINMFNLNEISHTRGSIDNYLNEIPRTEKITEGCSRSDSDHAIYKIRET